MNIKIINIFYKIFIYIGIITVATFSLLFAQGFRFDPKQGELISTGILSVASHPSKAAVYLDDRFTVFTDSLLDGIPVGRLNVRLEFGNYHPWESTIYIDNKNITKINPLLIPLNIDQFVEILADVDNVFVDSLNRGLAIGYSDLNMLYFVDFKTGKKSFFDFDDNDDFMFFVDNLDSGSSFNFANQSSSINNINSQLSSDGKMLLVLHGQSLWNLNVSSNKSSLVDNFEFPLEDAFWYPDSLSIVLVFDNWISIVDTDGRNYHQLFQKNPNSSVFFISKTKELYWQFDDKWQYTDFEAYLN